MQHPHHQGDDLDIAFKTGMIAVPVIVVLALVVVGLRSEKNETAPVVSQEDVSARNQQQSGREQRCLTRG